MIAEVCIVVAFLLCVNIRKFWLNVTDSQRAEKSPRYWLKCQIGRAYFLSDRILTWKNEELDFQTKQSPPYNVLYTYRNQFRKAMSQTVGIYRKKTHQLVMIEKPCESVC